ncbi:MAG: hypothetical protein WBW79_09190 [Desulfocapsaceae bacterium]
MQQSRSGRITRNEKRAQIGLSDRIKRRGGRQHFLHGGCRRRTIQMTQARRLTAAWGAVRMALLSQRSCLRCTAGHRGNVLNRLGLCRKVSTAAIRSAQISGPGQEKNQKKQ